jgi:hypothetical protein
MKRKRLSESRTAVSTRPSLDGVIAITLHRLHSARRR